MLNLRLIFLLSLIAIPAFTAQDQPVTLRVGTFVLTENLVSDCFGIEEWKALAKAARSTRRLRLKFSTPTLRCLPSYRFEDNRTHAFEESTVETY